MKVRERIRRAARSPWLAAVAAQLWCVVGLWLAVSFHMPPALAARGPEWLLLTETYAWIAVAWLWVPAGVAIAIWALAIAVRTRRLARGALCVVALCLEVAILLHLEAPLAEAIWWRWHGHRFRAAARSALTMPPVRAGAPWTGEGTHDGVAFRRVGSVVRFPLEENFPEERWSAIVYGPGLDQAAAERLANPDRPSERTIRLEPGWWHVWW